MRKFLLKLWHRLPIIVQALVRGVALLVAGTIPWVILVSVNLKYSPRLPWAVVPAGLYLWLYWRFVTGTGWRQQTAQTRRTLCRANSLSAEIWGMALIAGVLGLAGVLLLQGVMARLVSLPQQQQGSAVSQVPFVSLLLLVVMSSLVAGVVEETTFRGYMQVPIERRHGPVIAILVTGGLFGFAHFTHPEVGLVLLPYYMSVAAVYGTLAYLTNSIFPSMVLHAGGNMLAAVALFSQGRSEWQISTTRSPLIWETGPDQAFWVSLLGLFLVGGAAVAAYGALARITRNTRESATAAENPQREVPGTSVELTL